MISRWYGGTSLFLCAVLVVGTLSAHLAQAALYLPGETLDPACAPTDTDCGIVGQIASSTAYSIPYYATNGSVLSTTSALTIHGDVVSARGTFWTDQYRESSNSQYNPSLNALNGRSTGVLWAEAGTDVLPQVLVDGTSLVYDGKMWVFGGFNGTDDDDTILSSKDGVAWEEVGTLPDISEGHTSLVYNGKMWLIGGWVGQTAYSRKVFHSTDGITWTEAGTDALPVATAYHDSVVYDGKMWVIGGGTDAGRTRKVYYSTDGITWTEAGTDAFPLAIAHNTQTSLVYDGKMWVMGGFAGSGYSEKVYYSTDGITWTEAGTDALPEANDYHRTLVYDGKMWILGGYNVSGSLQKVYYSTDGITWTEAGLLPEEMWGMQALVFDGQMWIISGGLDSGFTRKVYHTIPTIRGGFAVTDSGTSSLLTVLSNGNVGIGTTTPTASLHIYKTNSTQDVGYTGQTININDSGGHYTGSTARQGLDASLTMTGSFSPTGGETLDLRGGSFSAAFRGTYAADESGEVMNVTGLSGRATVSGTFVSVNDYLNIIGMQAASGGNTDPSIISAHYAGHFTATGTADRNYGLYVGAVTGADRNYGLYIDSLAEGANNYALYASTTAKNYLAGNLGIGTTSPNAKLTINTSGSDVTPLIIYTNGSAGNYTATNSAMFIRDAAGIEMLRIYASDPDPAYSNYNTWNLYIGREAGANQPSDNTSAGYGNTGIGYRALTSITTGYENSAFGIRSMEANTTGSNNSAFGSSALGENIDGHDNTAFGLTALRNNLSGDNNTAVGTYSLYYQTTGNNNTALGNAAGYNPLSVSTQYQIVSDTDMVLIGYGATKNNSSTLTNGIAIGSGAHVLESNQAVLGNDSITTTLLKGWVAIGTTSPFAPLAVEIGIDSAGFTTKDFNTNTNTGSALQIQMGADNGNTFSELRAVSSGWSAWDNLVLQSGGGKVGIGTTSPSYTLHVGNTAVAGVVSRFENSTGYCDINPTNTALVCTSDARLKRNILTIESKTSLEKILQVDAVTYNWIKEEDDASPHAGFIAQDVKDIFPDLVSEDQNGTLSVSYTGFIPYIVESIQELANTFAEWKDHVITKMVTTDKLCVSKSDGSAVCVTGDELDAALSSESGPSSEEDEEIEEVEDMEESIEETEEGNLIEEGEEVEPIDESVEETTEVITDEPETNPASDTIEGESL